MRKMQVRVLLSEPYEYKTHSRRHRVAVHLDTKYNYSCLVDYETEGYYPDCEAGTCDDSICRCYTISSVRIDEFLSWKAESFLEKIVDAPNHPLERYALERVLSRSLYSSMFETHWSPGYYGDEVDRISVDTSSREYYDLEKRLETFQRLETITEKVRMALTLEYGYLLPEIQSVESWEIQRVNVKDVSVSKDTLSRVNQDLVQGYTYRRWDNKTPVGVAVPKEGVLKLIDGFHRWSAYFHLKNRRKITLVVPA